jgi:hypothetical protein
MKTYESVSEMKGIGEEWLVDSQGNLVAVYLEGKLKCEVYYLDDYRELLKTA